MNEKARNTNVNEIVDGKIEAAYIPAFGVIIRI